MCIEGAVGIAAGLTAGSIALVGWALSSAVEGLASVIVIMRFTGSRTLSETSERRAQKAVAISFWVLAPYVEIGSVRNLWIQERPGTSVVGIASAASSIALMPALGIAKKRLGKSSDRARRQVKASRTCRSDRHVQPVVQPADLRIRSMTTDVQRPLNWTPDSLKPRPRFFPEALGSVAATVSGPGKTGEKPNSKVSEDPGPFSGRPMAQA
jgi:hypothetical protein